MTLVSKKMPHPHCVSNGDERRNTAAVHFLWEKDIKPQKDCNIMKFKQRSQKITPKEGNIKKGKREDFQHKSRKGQKN